MSANSPGKVQPVGDWASHLIYMEAGAELAPAELESAEVSGGRVAALAPGVVACALLGLVSWFAVGLAERAFGNVLIGTSMVAMAAGLVVGNLPGSPVALREGSRWVVRVILPLGIVLLGARIQVSELVAVGARGLMLSVGVIALAGLILLAASRWLGMSGKRATLLAVGTGICGGSAVVAVAPAIEASEDDVAVSVSTMALLGLVLMFGLPPLGAAFGMPPDVFGAWAGLTIQQTPQVVAAGFAYGAEAGEVAMVVKLVRIALLAPVVVGVGIGYRMLAKRGDDAGSERRARGVVPGFVLGLVGFALASSLGLLPELTVVLPADSALGALSGTVDVGEAAAWLSRICLILAMAAVGLETRWAALRRTAPAAFGAAAFASTIIVCATALALF